MNPQWECLGDRAAVDPELIGEGCRNSIDLMGHINVLGKCILNLTLKLTYWKVTMGKGFLPLGVSEVVGLMRYFGKARASLCWSEH